MSTHDQTLEAGDLTSAGLPGASDRAFLVVYLGGEGGEGRSRVVELPDGVEVRLAPPESAEIEAVSMPGSFSPEGEKKKLLLPIMQGMLWDGRGEHLSHVNGWQEGAMLSAHRVVSQICRRVSAAEA